MSTVLVQARHVTILVGMTDHVSQTSVDGGLSNHHRRGRSTSERGGNIPTYLGAMCMVLWL